MKRFVYKSQDGKSGARKVAIRESFAVEKDRVDFANPAFTGVNRSSPAAHKVVVACGIANLRGQIDRVPVG